MQDGGDVQDEGSGVDVAGIRRRPSGGDVHDEQPAECLAGSGVGVDSAAEAASDIGPFTSAASDDDDEMQ